jgi:cob(I)alamin adenosyltransferase
VGHFEILNASFLITTLSLWFKTLYNYNVAKEMKMVRLTRIYTRGGDKGKTSLGEGSRVFKHDGRIEAIGAVDESNAALGLVQCSSDHKMTQLLRHLQNDLFDVGADLCVPDITLAKLKITVEQVVFLEKTIDAYNALLAPLTSFVLPGGSLMSAQLHFARTVVRRAERRVCALHVDSTVNADVIRYLNRLSDLLFVLARVANNEGKDDVLWVPGRSQSS